MAKLVKLQSQYEAFQEEYFARIRAAEENRYIEYNAAVRIQSWFRKCKVQAYLKHLRRNATIIQRAWRSYAAISCFRQTLKRKYQNMKRNFYNEMAIKIQRRWRGYYVRAYIHNYYGLKKYLQAVARKNEAVRKGLQEIAQQQKKDMEQITLEREERKKIQQAQKMHHLLSTQQNPGVFNSPYREYPHEMEQRLRSVHPLLGKRSAKKKPKESPTKEALPPIPYRKPQGPFRDPAEVLQQRYRPLEPTLRVATSITTLEEAREELHRDEWRRRINDHTFLPFSKAHKSKNYEKMLNSTTPYESFGCKYFREEKKEKLQGKRPFKTIFTTTHLFDKLGQLYSNAGNIV